MWGKSSHSPPDLYVFQTIGAKSVENVSIFFQTHLFPHFGFTIIDSSGIQLTHLILLIQLIQKDRIESSKSIESAARPAVSIDSID